MVHDGEATTQILTAKYLQDSPETWRFLLLCIRPTHKGVRNSLRKFLQQLRFNRTDLVDLVKIIDASGLDY